MTVEHYTESESFVSDYQRARQITSTEYPELRWLSTARILCMSCCVCCYYYERLCLSAPG
jgi:hypothetical protein